MSALAASVAARLATVRVRVSCLTSRQANFAAFLAGSASVLAFAPVFAWPLLFITLPLFVWILDDAASPRLAALRGWWFAFGYFFFNLFWIGEAFLVEAEKFAWLLPFAVTLLPAGLALFWALAAAAYRRANGVGFARVLLFAVVFSVAEWLRGNVLTGLPWNVPGYALTGPLLLMQSAGLFGIYGLTLIALTVFAGPLALLADRSRDASYHAIALKAVGLGLVPLVALSAYGASRLSQPVAVMDNVKVRIVQPSVLQTEKWRPEHQRRIFDDHLSLSLLDPTGARDDLTGITHVVWPEAAMPFFPLESQQALAEIADMLPAGRTLITGAIRRVVASADDPAAATLARAQVYNSIIAFDDAAGVQSIYDKIHLVPFGEYLPADTVLSALGLKKLTHGLSAFSSGPMPRPALQVAGLPPVLSLVCYEALFPKQLAMSGPRAGVIVNVTNDGWFGNTSGPRQHFHQTRVRAVEQGLTVIRAANNGISAIIDPYGRIVAQLAMNVRGTADAHIAKPIAQPLYARVGDWIFAAMLAVWAVAILAMPRVTPR